MEVNQKDWSCPKKQKARYETIISQYEKHFGLQRLPKEKQYWTMCGQCATSDGKPLKGCELDQLVQEGLIKQSQFHGVEINTEIHELNTIAYPHVSWHNGDFYQTMITASAENWFNPSVINIDIPSTPERACLFLSKIMAFLTAIGTKVLVIANMMTRARCYTVKDGNYIIKRLNKYPQFTYALENGNWSVPKEYYHYEGTGETGSRSWFGSIVFVNSTKKSK